MNRETMKQDYKPFLNVGDVFMRIRYDYRGVKKEYWKVTKLRPPDKGSGFMATPYWSYRVIKCTKTGKEFKDTNGFACRIDEALKAPDSIVGKDTGCKEDFRVVNRGTTVGEKANIKHGLQVGKIKRRIGYLQMRIENDKNELVRLENKLVELEYQKEDSQK